MSAIGTKADMASARHMSAFGGKADIGWIAAILALRGHFGDSDVADITKLAT
jgi:hypothetical protein